MADPVILPKNMVVIFNGGKATRMGGGDKGAVMIKGTSLFVHTRNNMLRPRQDLYVSVAADYARPTYQRYTVIRDETDLLPDAAGVILSVLSSLKYAKKLGYKFMISTPVDTPFLHYKFNEDMQTYWLGDDTPVVATSTEGERVNMHPLHALWPVSALDEIARLAMDEGVRRMTHIHDRLGSHQVNYAAADMRNINSMDDVKRAENECY